MLYLKYVDIDTYIILQLYTNTANPNMHIKF